MIFVKRNRSTEPVGIGLRNRERLRRAKELQRTGLSTGRIWAAIRKQKEAKADIDALFHVFFQKCAYCESEFNATGRNQLEHYRPKAKFFSKMFLWSNWLCSCGICNEKKWSHWPLDATGSPLLLDPTKEDPGRHIGFVDAAIVGTTIRGTETIRMLGLHRKTLERDRRRWLTLIEALLILTLHSDQTLAGTARSLLTWSIQPWAPYSAMVRSKLDLLCPGYSGRHSGATPSEPLNLYQDIASFIEKHTADIARLM